MPWPKYLHIPSAEEFEHEVFAPDGSPFPRSHRFNCGTQCCLVGHTAIAFAMPGYAPLWMEGDPGKAARAFLKEFCRRAGFPVPKGHSVGWWASDVFEDVNVRESIERIRVSEDHPGLTGEQAHRLWVETAAHFGYTVDVPVKEALQYEEGTA